ncbi:hypothetical protein OE88DRAFT_1722019 [Heliocybe sulcata]|uniref:Uncharacterized protein n=1 Tax=Heliocybe sulcata TaxID=5364 RepID=A0A5C3NGE4_9AGAM|nr:hypothetical protein OE88DRAFT_1722019 [Heliocybe sulcata]
MVNTQQQHWQDVRRKRRPQQKHTRPAPIDNAWGGWEEPQDHSAWFQQPAPGEEPWDLRDLEKMDHVDMVYELVPWWREGVKAAESGIVMKMADFLEQIEARHRDGVVAQDSQADEEDMDNPWRPRDPQDEARAWLEGSAMPREQYDEWGRPIGCSGQQWDQHPQEQDPEWKMILDEADRSSPWGNSDKTRTDDGPVLERVNYGPQDVQDGSEQPPPASDSQPNEQDSWRFVEAVARRRAANGRRKNDMHTFYQMPTEDKLRNIQTLIHDLRGR